MKKEGIKIKGHKGTFYVVGELEKYNRKVYVLESEIYGDEANHILVTEKMKVLFANEYNWGMDYEDALENKLFDKYMETHTIEEYRQTPINFLEDKVAKKWGVTSVE